MTKPTAFDDAVRPDSWTDFVGQKRMKSRLEVSIEAAIAQRRRLDDVLFIAQPGTGKTTLAQLIADRMFCDFVTVTCPIKIDRFIDIVEELEDGVVFIDELHAASKQFQEMLQPALEEDRVLITPEGFEIDVSGIVFIAATITEFAPKILAPLQQRFQIRPDWEPYTHEDIATILGAMAHRLGFELSDDVCDGLASACGSTPRLAKRLVKAARDLAAVGREVTAESVLNHVGVDADGLTADHLEYLRVIRKEKTVGLKNLANTLCMSPASVEALERSLVHLGFIQRGSTGRRLTPTGKAKLGGKKQSNAA